MSNITDNIFNIYPQDKQRLAVKDMDNPDISYFTVCFCKTHYVHGKLQQQNIVAISAIASLGDCDIHCINAIAISETK